MCICVYSTQFSFGRSLTMSNLRQLHKMIICISSLMRHSMAWVTMKLPQSGGAGTDCDVADSMRVPMPTV